MWGELYSKRLEDKTFPERPILDFQPSPLNNQTATKSSGLRTRI